MERFKINLKARKITLSDEDAHMASGIAERKLREDSTYSALPSNIKDLVKSNVLIVAATDNMRRADSNKIDILIGNLQDAIDLVIKDVGKASAGILN